MVHRTRRADYLSRPIAFLAYAARSGSTRLASELGSASPDVLVVPETRLIELVVTNPEVPNVAQRLAAIDRDWQLGNYPALDVEALKQAFVDLGDVCSREDLLWALGSAFHPKSIQATSTHRRYTMVFKWGNASFFWPEIALHFDDATLLCVHCLLYTSPSPRDRQKSRMPSSA